MILQNTSLRRCEKNFRNFRLVDCKILAFEVTKFHFLPLRKFGQLHFTRLDHYEKMSKMVATLWIHYSRQVVYMLKKFKSFEIVQHIGKNQ